MHTSARKSQALSFDVPFLKARRHLQHPAAEGQERDFEGSHVKFWGWRQPRLWFVVRTAPAPVSNTGALLAR
eukprot:2020812-Rhodomonas_salina.1